MSEIPYGTHSNNLKTYGKTDVSLLFVTLVKIVVVISGRRVVYSFFIRLTSKKVIPSLSPRSFGAPLRRIVEVRTYMTRFSTWSTVLLNNFTRSLLFHRFVTFVPSSRSNKEITFFRGLMF